MSMFFGEKDEFVESALQREERAHERTKQALASATADVERFKAKAEKYEVELRRVIEWHKARNLADTSATGQMAIRIERVLKGLEP